MYLEPTTTYRRKGWEHTRKARFLILVVPPSQTGVSDLPVRAIVRKVALCNTAGWLEGHARAWGCSIPISGNYGDQGSPRVVPRWVYERAETVPVELVGCSYRSENLRDWARKRFPEVAI